MLVLRFKEKIWYLTTPALRNVGVFLCIPYTKHFYPKNKTFFCGIKNYFQALKIYNQALKIYNQALKINFQALKIIINIGIGNFMSVERKLFPSGKKRKLCFYFVFPLAYLYLLSSVEGTLVRE